MLVMGEPFTHLASLCLKLGVHVNLPAYNIHIFYWRLATIFSDSYLFLWHITCDLKLHSHCQSVPPLLLRFSQNTDLNDLTETIESILNNTWSDQQETGKNNKS